MSGLTSMVLMVAAMSSAGAEGAEGGTGPLETRCPERCHCGEKGSYRFLLCPRGELQSVPEGRWPGVSQLVLNDNRIAHFAPGALKGFPDAIFLIMDRNPLEELRLEALLEAPALEDVSFRGCGISRVVPLPEGTRLPNLFNLDLSQNKMRSMPPNILAGFTNTQLLFKMDNNPTVLPGDRTLFTFNNKISFSAKYADASGITKETFKGVPKIDLIDLSGTGLKNVKYIFSYLRHLTNLHLGNNPIERLEAGVLPEGLRYLTLSHTRLRELSPAGALEGLEDIHIVRVHDTPLACACAYEEALRWARGRGAWVEASCPGRPPCPFDDQRLRHSPRHTKRM